LLFEEAQWLNRRLSVLPSDALYPMCNLGSSTDHFRRVEQPYIDQYLFEPARVRNLKVIHVDAKPADGVDLVGDLTDPRFLARLAELDLRSVMCCNLLEHVVSRQVICEAVLSILKPGGYLIATVPYRFPYHEDPIDTMYRPRVKDLVASFPGAAIHDAATVRASRFTFDMNRNYRSLGRLIARACLPFYRSRQWWPAVRRLFDIAVGYQVTCVVLLKQDATQ
jgi:hypothetical protein